MFLIHPDGITVCNRAEIAHTQQLIFRKRRATVEMTGPDDKLDLDRRAGFLKDFAVQCMFEALTLIDAPIRPPGNRDDLLVAG